MTSKNIPKFVQDGAFNWRVKGYHYILNEEELLKVEQENDENPWYVIAHVVEQAKLGDFSKCSYLSRFFDYNLSTNAAPVAMLITGDIGRFKDLKKLTDIMQNGSDGFRVYACKAAANSGCMWMIPYMLEAWHMVEGVDAHENIGYSIADLLDPINNLDDVGPIGSRASIYSNKVGGSRSNLKLKGLVERVRDKDADALFHEIVMNKFLYLKELYKSEQVILWAGEERNVYGFAQFFLNLITSNHFNLALTPLVVPLRQKFEAATGINCSSFFQNERFCQIEAVGILEYFLYSREVKKFQENKRYYFGNLIDS